MAPAAADRAVLPVSVVAPVYNEESSITEFLDALILLDPLPAEVVLVDGGSTDRTIEIVKRVSGKPGCPVRVRVIVDPSCSLRQCAGPIARARNVGIASARHDVIACTDAGCRVTSDWLGVLTQPLLRTDTPLAVGGWYKPDARTTFEKAVARVSVRPAKGMSPSTFIPSSRSIAFTRKAWESIKGYPEDSYTGEDTMFVLRLRRAGIPVRFVPEAIVLWRMRGTLGSFLQQVFRYGQGDGRYRILPGNVVKNLFRVFLGVVLIAAGLLVSQWWFPVAGGYYLLIPYAREPRSLLSGVAPTVVLVAALLKPLADSIYVIGYLFGRRQSPPAAAASERRMR